MDSLTQVTLGAAVGEAVLGRRLGWKAPAWGAAFGTLPDLDVLANPFLSNVASLAFHRGPSHSLLFVLVGGLLFGAGLARLHRDDGVPWRRWAGFVIAVLGTHVALDCLTTYGTQVFWPFSTHSLILGTIFIIDPAYTLPLAAGLLVGLFYRRDARRRRWANHAGLALSTLYLLATGINKLHVESVFEASLRAQDLPAERVFTKATAFNNVLWTGIAKGEDGFYVGFYSLLDDDRRVDFRYVPKRHHLLGDAADSRAVERLRWFSHGYFIVREAPDGTLLVHDLRFGRSDLGLTRNGRYIFTFRLQRGPGGRVSGFTRDDPQVRATGDLLRRFVARIGGREDVVAHGPPLGPQARMGSDPGAFFP
jgi:inner membrane protein